MTSGRGQFIEPIPHPLDWDFDCNTHNILHVPQGNVNCELCTKWAAHYDKHVNSNDPSFEVALRDRENEFYRPAIEREFELVMQELQELRRKLEKARRDLVSLTSPSSSLSL